ncbi:FtsH protease activity modulator HflK [Achromobacter seleniivolatilans]|uniref:Protein HflK n=1 Tax=Achromobacter seleniivolatilans TaxID=3047478 RepID=A0ABY9M922_9BURK|nr:FtsH protease activity modulator HflK [Achromobacter sp. R39]WMD23118.1 FtsH protease activity modulator HflK [Achromobacter sp. R39]
MPRIIKLFNLNDPGWGRGNNNGSEPPPKRPQGSGDGPPDLDEVWRDFNNRIGSLFGRKGGGGGNNRPGNRGGITPPSPRGARIGLGVIALVAVGVWAASGFYIVQEGQVAVVTQFGKYKSTSQAGFQWRLPYPIQSQEIVNVSQLRTFEVGFRGGSRNKVLPEALMLTTDENIVDMQFVVQYRLRADGAPDYLFMTRDPDESVRQASETAMREVVGKQSMDFVLYEGRTTVATQVQALMQQILDRYQTGVQVSTVAIQNVQPPEQVQAAFDDAVKAGQDRERQINEGQAYANQVVPLASGQASRMTEQAEGYKAKVVGDAQGNTSRFTSVLGEYEKAPLVTRQRMYLESMQDIFTRASKVMVDTKSNNNMLYLPLDKIMHLAAQDASKSGSVGNPGSPALISPPVQPPLRGNAVPVPQSSGSSNSNTLPRDRTSR